MKSNFFFVVKSRKSDIDFAFWFSLVNGKDLDQRMHLLYSQFGHWQRRIVLNADITVD
jgi:hypothetical protein